MEAEAGQEEETGGWGDDSDLPPKQVRVPPDGATPPVEPTIKYNTARRKLMTSEMAYQRFKRAILEAASDIAHEFHGDYMARLMMSETGQNLLDANNPASTFETLKKGFLFHLNSTGHYLVLREHLRHAVSHLVQQCALVLRPQGFKDHKEFQNFLHDLYIFLCDTMHEALNETDAYEVMASDRRSELLKETNKLETTLKQLLIYAEEAQSVKDWETCQRLHLQRICLVPDAFAQPWVDYAIMWCARGDDRMAEIALREALKIEPYSIHALLLSGVIAARNRDERALGFIGQALSIHPLAPEIVVLLACAHQVLGNEITAKYFFLKARLLHCLVTGLDPTQAEDDFKKFAAKPALTGDEKSADGLLSSRSGGGKGKSKKVRKKDEDKNGKEPTSSASGLKKGKKKKKGKSSKEGEKSGRSDKGKKKDKKSGRKGKKKRTDDDDDDKVTPMVRDEGNLFSRKMSVTGKDTQEGKSSEASKYNYDFPIEITEDNKWGMHLPELGPSILFTWDVTDDPACKLPTVKKSGISNPDVYTSVFRKGSSAEGSQDVEGAEMLSKLEQYLFNLKRTSKVSQLSLGPSETPKGGRRKSKRSSKVSTSSKEGGSTSPKKKGGASGRKKKKDKDEEGSKGSGRSRSGKKTPKSGRSGKGKGGSAGRKKREDADEHVKIEGPQRNVWTTRLGSEYIWTAQLLLRYHAHDFFDMCIARELHLTEKRTVPFFYLLSQSLYLRDRGLPAKLLVDEMLQMHEENRKNPFLWELKGHILKSAEEPMGAIESYHNCLDFADPEQDVQLTYLLYGSLASSFKNVKLAKAIFLKGVNMYRSLYMWITLGDMCYEEGRYEEAETAYSQANYLDNTNPYIWGKLSLVSLAQGSKTLAEQCYKWAIRFGLKNGPVLEAIKKLQEETGMGDPSFPRVPNCVPHEFFLKRLGLNHPIDIYKQALESPERTDVKKKNNTKGDGDGVDSGLNTRKSSRKSMAILSDEEEDEEEERDDKPVEVDLKLNKRPSQLFKQTA